MNKEKNKVELNKFDEIKSGKYREAYLVYNRKSTDEAENQKNSISYQKSENARFAKRENLLIASITIKNFCNEGVVSEKHSGFKEDDEMLISDQGLVQYRIERPKFQRMVQLVNEGYFKGIICLCWDRLSRNRGDDVVIRKLMRKGSDIHFVYATYDKSSAGALHMDIDGMFAQHHSRVTSEKVTLTIRNARSKGICTYRANIGYLNPGKMEYKPFDPERAPILLRLFELCDTGEWSLADLARYAKEQGLVSVPMRRRRTQDELLAEEDESVDVEKTSRPLTTNHIGRILTNPFYTGMVRGNDGQWVKSTSHEPLVNEELFNRVQAILGKRRTSIHYTEKLDLPLRGAVRCAYCKRVFTPYTQKGKEYYSSRCLPECENPRRNFNFKYISDEIGKLLSNLNYSEDEISVMEAFADTDIALFEEKRRKALEEVERRKKKVREDLSYIYSNKLALLKSGIYTPEGLAEEESQLQSKLTAFQLEEQVSDEAMRETMKDIWKLSELIKHLIPKYVFADSYDKEKIIRNIFSELYVSGNTLTYNLQKGYECFQNRFDAFCEPLAWLSELAKDSEQIKSAIQILESSLDK